MLSNTATRYGPVARLLHWSVAILVLTALILGLVGALTPRQANTVVFLQVLYSAHKTIGVTVLALAVIRVVWAVTQPRPVPLHPNRQLETLAAETAHWLLYVAIFVMPLSGWVIHSAEVGFAPIWWPFGQNLPFVPKSEALAATAATVHFAAAIVVSLTVAAHIGGALKHALIDRDNTLARMWRGTASGTQSPHHAKFANASITALAIWAVAVGGAIAVSLPTEQPALNIAPRPPTATATSAPGWAVQDGSVTIEVQQLGAQVTGTFAAWQASIAYDPETGTGRVEAVIDTTSLSLGSVSDQAKGPEFFDTANFATATFTGDITQIDGQRHAATGNLSLVGRAVPVTVPFDLVIVEGVATMSGAVALDRRDFGMGTAYTDEATVGFAVNVNIALTARPVH